MDLMQKPDKWLTSVFLQIFQNNFQFPISTKLAIQSDLKDDTELARQVISRKALMRNAPSSFCKMLKYF